MGIKLKVGHLYIGGGVDVDIFLRANPVSAVGAPRAVYLLRLRCRCRKIMIGTTLALLALSTET